MIAESDPESSVTFCFNAYVLKTENALSILCMVVVAASVIIMVIVISIIIFSINSIIIISSCSNLIIVMSTSIIMRSAWEDQHLWW